MSNDVPQKATVTSEDFAGANHWNDPLSGTPDLRQSRVRPKQRTTGVDPERAVSGTFVERLHADISCAAESITIASMNMTIASATNEQQHVSSSINKRMADLNRISGTTEEQGQKLAQISTNIKSLAENLKEIAGHFKT